MDGSSCDDLSRFAADPSRRGVLTSALVSACAGLSAAAFLPFEEAAAKKQHRKQGCRQ